MILEHLGIDSVMSPHMLPRLRNKRPLKRVLCRIAVPSPGTGNNRRSRITLRFWALGLLILFDWLRSKCGKCSALIVGQPYFSIGNQFLFCPPEFAGAHDCWPADTIAFLNNHYSTWPPGTI